MADALGIQAGSLTYGAFLSIPPALLIVGSVLGFVLAGDAEAQARVVDQIANVIPGLEPFVRDFLQSAIDGRASVGLLGLVTLTWTASGFAARARFALGEIFRTARPGLITGRFAAIWQGLPVVVGLMASIAAMGIAGGMGLGDGSGMAWRAGTEVLVLAALVRRVPVRVQGPDAWGRADDSAGTSRVRCCSPWGSRSLGRSARRTSRTSWPAPPRCTGPSGPSSDCSRSCTRPCGSSCWVRNSRGSRRSGTRRANIERSPWTTLPTMSVPV